MKIYHFSHFLLECFSLSLVENFHSGKMAVGPDWLNAEFALKVLRKYENDESIEMKEMICKPATAKGDNYTSEMIRVSLEYSRSENGQKKVEKKSLVVKIAPYVEGIHKELVINDFPLNYDDNSNLFVITKFS